MRGKARFLLFLFTPGGEYTSIFLLIIIIPKMKDTIYEENRLPEGRMPALRVEPMPVSAVGIDQRSFPSLMDIAGIDRLQLSEAG